MKIITQLLVIASAGQALACVHATGYVGHDPLPNGPSEGKFAQLWDNGALVCQGTFGVDQDGHYAVPCNPGYYYTLTQNLVTAWYGYGNNHFQWTQAVKTGSLDCGYCNPKTGNCLQCPTSQWDVWMYC